MSEPTFLICIGATKAGTTWLYDYLRNHPDCHLRLVKELHYFDTRAGRGREFYLRHADERIAGAEARKRAASLLKKAKFSRQIRELKTWRKLIEGRDDSHDAYLRFVHDGVGDKKLVADITPCYATLGRDDFAQMAQLTQDVRFVFLLRDPVDRAWSQARMNGSRRAARSNRPVRPAITRNFDSFLDGKQEMFTLRSDYARTLRELLSVVPRERVHLEFFETLFDPRSLRRLTDFLGIAPQPGQVDRVRHEGTSMPLVPARRARARRLLRDQYTFCDQFFDGQLPDRWRAQMEAS